MDKKEIQNVLKTLINLGFRGLVSDDFDYTIVYNYGNESYDVISNYYESDEIKVLDDKEIVDEFLKEVKNYIRKFDEEN
jgi:hypothetical protein